MATTDTYEAEYLVLASESGMEALRQQCDCGCHDNATAWGSWKPHLRKCRWDCCGWLPLPEAERLGALVRLTNDVGGVEIHWMPKGLILDEPSYGDCWEADLGGTARCYSGLTPEAALTRALLAATGEVVK